MNRCIKDTFRNRFLKSIYFVNCKNVKNCSTRSDATEYDIVISGGGMVGSAMVASLSLGQERTLSGTKILLLEGSSKTEYKLPSAFSSRVVAINQASINLLKSFGAWSHIEEMRWHEVKRMQVWESASDSLITFNNPDLQADLACIVENDVLTHAITRQLNTCDNHVEVRYDSRVKDYIMPFKSSPENPSAGVKICLESGEKITTKLLIGADGFKSLVRKAANIHTLQWAYNQSAVVAVLKLSEATENNVAWQRFLKTGPIALLPLSSDHSCLIWSTTTEEAKKLMQLEDENFVDAVNRAYWSDDDKNPMVNYTTQLFDSVLTTAGLDGSSQQQLPPTIMDLQSGSRASFPLGLCHASQYVKPRVALIGDAAHRVHPLAGQGVNLGFGDVACLRDKLITALQNGADIGSLTHLLGYESERQRHVVPIMATLDGLSRLYGTTWTPLVMARSLGLQATNACKPVKEFLMNSATS